MRDQRGRNRPSFMVAAEVCQNRTGAAVSDAKLLIYKGETLGDFSGKLVTGVRGPAGRAIEADEKALREAIFRGQLREVDFRVST